MTNPRSHAFAFWLISALSSAAIAQGPAPGLRLLRGVGSTETWLVDTLGNITHTWTTASPYGRSIDLDHDGNLLRMLDGIQFPIGRGGGIERVALDGTRIWEYWYTAPGVLAHHDFEPLPNGNVLLLAWEEKTLNDAIFAGRDPALLRTSFFYPDHIVEIEQTGPTSGHVVWEWRLWNHLIQDHDPSKLNFGVVGSDPGRVDVNFPPQISYSGDWTHCNSIDYDAENDWIVISSRHLSEIWVIDHSTTSQEAAGSFGGRRGKGGRILYRWGNPQAYRAGTSADQQLFGQHDARFVRPGRPGAGNITMFDNGWNTPRQSRVLEIQPPRDATGNFVRAPGTAFGPTAPVWEHSGTFDSVFMSGTERLPNGNTLICTTLQTTVHEVTPSGATVWQYTLPTNPFHARFVERTLWAEQKSIPLDQGGSATMQLLVGARHANQPYLVLGSMTGTRPGIPAGAMTLPLVADAYTTATLIGANVAPFANTLGTLDASGRAAATLTLPPGLPPALSGLELRHAFVVFSGPGNAPAHVSNPVTITLE